MTYDELARRRADNARRLAGARKRPTQDEPRPGDIRVMVEDLRSIKGMAEEVMAEALALGDNDIVALIGALILHVGDVVSEVEQAERG